MKGEEFFRKLTEKLTDKIEERIRDGVRDDALNEEIKNETSCKLMELADILVALVER